MKNSLILICLLSFLSCASTAQVMSPKTNTTMRSIEVTGTATTEIIPDEVIFSINIQEFWLEEFEEGKEYKDYRTKVDIVSIENEVVKELKSLGIGLGQLTLDRAGNYWRQQGKDFLVNKEIEVKLNSPKQANEITNTLKSRGIQSMNIKEMKHSKLSEFKNTTKANAIKAAKEKAMLLAGALDEKIGRVLHIIEVDKFVNVAPKMYASMRTSAAMEDSSGGGVDYENFGKIHIKEEVRVIFEIQ